MSQRIGEIEHMFEGMRGPELAAAVAAVDVRALDAAAALDYALAAARVAGWAGRPGGRLGRRHGGGRAVPLPRALPRPRAGPDGVEHRLDRDRAAVAEVRAAYGCSTVAASARVGFADALVGLPRLGAALAEGSLHLDRVRVLIIETEPLADDPTLRREVVDRVLEADAADRASGGSGLTVRQVTLWVRREVVAADPTRADRSARDTRSERRAWFQRRPEQAEGVFGLTGPLDSAAECWAAVDALARQWRREGRPETLDRLRFDAAHHLLTTRPGADRAPAGRWLGQVTMPLTSLLGLDDSPGEILGVGAVPAPLARSLMARSVVWRRLLTDPVEGHVVLQRVRGYRPTNEMRRFVLTRAGGVCAARGCGATRGLQIDHVDAYPDGPTSSINLSPGCATDHNGKTHGHWRHQMDPDTGALYQTSPLGRRYATRPTPPVGPTGMRAPDCEDCGAFGDHGDRDGPEASVPDDDRAELRRDRLSGELLIPPPDTPPPDQPSDEPPDPLHERVTDGLPGAVPEGLREAVPETVVGDPVSSGTLPPDPAADDDRWPQIEARLLERRRDEQRARAAHLVATRAAHKHRAAAEAVAEKAHLADMADWYARLDELTDHAMLAEIDADDRAGLDAGLDWGLDPATTAPLHAELTWEEVA